jgi:Domain of unknown function (DUF4160)
MTALPRLPGLRFVIFLDDHQRAHVHVFGEGQIKVNLFGEDKTAEPVWVDGMSRSDVRRAMAAVGEHREALITRWKEIHG